MSFLLGQKDLLACGELLVFGSVYIIWASPQHCSRVALYLQRSRPGPMTQKQSMQRSLALSEISPGTPKHVGPPFLRQPPIPFPYKPRDSYGSGMGGWGNLEPLFWGAGSCALLKCIHQYFSWKNRIDSLCDFLILPSLERVHTPPKRKRKIIIFKSAGWDGIC